MKAKSIVLRIGALSNPSSNIEMEVHMRKIAAMILIALVLGSATALAETYQYNLTFTPQQLTAITPAFPLKTGVHELIIRYNITYGYSYYTNSFTLKSASGAVPIGSKWIAPDMSISFPLPALSMPQDYCFTVRLNPNTFDAIPTDTIQMRLIVSVN